ncbi:MAG TPA: hypothetical protein VD926_07700, partial [Acidimicrobiales bacterium]|nr:hypothetical protein [Acidimicrobiales bacterium]
SGDPLGMALNDISNIAVVAAPAAKAAGIAGQAAEAGSLSARAASATQKIASGTAKVADLPVAPYRLPLTRAGEVIGKSAYNAEMAAAGAEGVQAGTLGSALQRVGLSQPLARFSPEGKLLSNELLEGRAREANYAHDVLEADLPQLETQLSQIPKANRAARQQVIDNYLETHQETIGPRVAELRSESAARISGMPFAHQLDPVRSPQGKLFGEADQADLAPVPEGYVRMSELRGGDMSTLYKGADDIVLPKPLADQVQSFFGAPMKGSEALRGVLGPVNKVNYTLKLGLSPAWATGNLVGNAFTTLANAGVRGLRQYASDIRTGDFADDSARLQRAAPTRATIDQMQMTAVPEAEGNFAQRITTKAVQKAQKVTFYRLAERFDNAARSAVFKTELSRGASPELALEKTLRAMGEFDKLSPFERDYVKQIAPFWTWHREILKMSKNMLEDHPIRSGAMLNLSRNLGSEQGEPGETEIEAGQLVPYGQAGEWFGGGYGGFGKKLGPLPRAALAVGTGQNPSTGKDLRVGQEFGEQNTPGLHNTGAAISQFVKSYPQARLTQAVRGEDDFHTPAEGIASFLGVDASHQPKRQKKGKGANPNSVSYWLK